MYDSARLQGPVKKGASAEWSTVDSEISGELKKIAESGGAIRVLSNTIASPSTSAIIAKLRESLGGTAELPAEGEDQVATPGVVDFKHVMYDAYSYSAMRQANLECFGEEVIPSYDFSKAKTIVSIAADFCANWLMHNTYVGQYAQTRKSDADWMSKHYHFESLMSVTGSNADVRKAIKPSEEGLVAISIYNHLAKKSGRGAIGGSNGEIDALTKGAAESLWDNRQNALVVAGANHKGIQSVVNGINDILGSYSSTINLDNKIALFQGNDQDVADLVKDMNSGKVKALLVYGTNPVYTLADSDGFVSGLKKVSSSGITVSFAQYSDETASRCDYICPDHHYLESWNDLNVVKDHYALVQPTISNLYNTRQAQESMLRWAGSDESFYDFMRNLWDFYSSHSLVIN